MAPDHIRTITESGANRAGENRRQEQPDGGRGTIDDNFRARCPAGASERPEAHTDRADGRNASARLRWILTIRVDPLVAGLFLHPKHRRGRRRWMGTESGENERVK